MNINKYLKFICYFAVVFAAVMNFLLPILHIPSIVKGGLVVIEVALLIYIIANLKKILRMKYINVLFLLVVIFFVVTLIGWMINQYSLLLYLLGLRNTFKFFIFFFALCLLFDKTDAIRIVKVDNILFAVNIIVALFEFLILKYNRDFLSGTFAFGVKGGNAGLIALFTIELCIICNAFLSKKISVSKFVIMLALILGISAIAELKIVFVLLIIILVLAIFLNQKNIRTYYMIGLGGIGLIFGIIILFCFFPEWSDSLSFSKIYNNIFGSEFGYSTKYDISRGRAFRQINDEFYKDDPIRKYFGFGIGNCDSSVTLNVKGTFYEKYQSKLHYDWFMHSMIYLETGMLGFLLFFSFFVINSINCYRIMKCYKNDRDIKVFLNSVFCFSIFTIISIFYDSFLRINYAYFSYAFLALPYILREDKLRLLMGNKAKVSIPNNQKKVGIMSMQRIINYGSFLQAYGLKQTVESFGYIVEFVDYKIGSPLIKNSTLKEKAFAKIKKLFTFFEYIRRKFYNMQLKDMYNDSLYNYLNISDERNYPYGKIDELIIGSDEVFNCLQGYPVCYSKELFGENYNIPIISYAACFGNATLKQLQKYKVDKEIGKSLSRFKAISVRDKNSFKIVNELTKKEPSINFDPVLIYNFQNDIIDNVKIQDYILLYVYASRLTDEEKDVIKNVALKMHKKIISIGSYQEIADYNYIINPFEIFAYFKHASFVITDTFHGSIFSIKMHANFCTIIRRGHLGNSNKLYDLLYRLDKTDRIIDRIADIEDIYNKKIDYEKTDKIIEKEKDRAIAFLKNNLL